MRTLPPANWKEIPHEDYAKYNLAPAVNTVPHTFYAVNGRTGILMGVVGLAHYSDDPYIMRDHLDKEMRALRSKKPEERGGFYPYKYGYYNLDDGVIYLILMEVNRNGKNLNSLQVYFDNENGTLSSMYYISSKPLGEGDPLDAFLESNMPAREMLDWINAELK